MDQGVFAALELARSGNRDALGRLVEGIQSKVYRLAVKVLGCPEDASDAAQEIIVKIILKLDTFRGECEFSTWVYQVAINHLRSAKKSRVEALDLSFDSLSRDLRRDL